MSVSAPVSILSSKELSDENISESMLVGRKIKLRSRSAVPFVLEWSSLYDPEKIELRTDINHPFTIKLSMKYPSFVDIQDDLNTAKIFLGIKNPQTEYKNCIEMGVYMGRLFISNVFDSISLPVGKLIEGIKLILTVYPDLKGKSSALLSAIDQSGKLLSEIKTGKMLSTDWNGDIAIGAHFKSLRIEGVQSTY